MTPAEQALIVEHVPFARWIAWKYRRQSPLSWGDDIQAAAFEGLVRASHIYDRTLGYEFTTYAEPRIRGFIVDEIRRLANQPRRRGADITVESFADCNGDSFGERLADNPADLVCATLGNRQQADRLLRILDPDDGQLVRSYYYDGLTLAEIGAELGISQSRVCQRLTAIRARLRRSCHHNTTT